MNRRSFLSGGAALAALLPLSADAKLPASIAFGDKELQGFWDAVNVARVQGRNSARGQATNTQIIEAINAYTAKHGMTWPITFRHAPGHTDGEVEAIFGFLRRHTDESGTQKLMLAYRIPHLGISDEFMIHAEYPRA